MAKKYDYLVLNILAWILLLVPHMVIMIVKSLVAYMKVNAITDPLNELPRIWKNSL